ncbi:MAG: DUF294 nucleotidyltransferase-like domain-containing protein, partial [Pseudomonadota bacterium]
ARVWAREQRFRIGVQLLRRLAHPREAGRAYTAVAEAVLTTLWPYIVAETESRLGPAPGQGAAVLSLGKAGSREMTATSDLDLIVVYDADPAETAPGQTRAAASWYARLTQTLVAALSAPTAEGALYDVDMRLRPSGRQGPVAVSWKSFEDYQRDRAWTWEHLALTRARPLAGEPALIERLSATITEVLAAPRNRDATLSDVRDMRARIDEAAADVSPWDPKSGPGRLLEIELALQTARLLTPGIDERAPAEMIDPLATAGVLSTAEAAHLTEAHGRLVAVQQLTRAALDGAYDPERGGAGLAALLADLCGVADSAALKAKLAADAEMSAAIVTRLLRV